MRSDCVVLICKGRHFRQMRLAGQSWSWAQDAQRGLSSHSPIRESEAGLMLIEIRTSMSTREVVSAYP